MSPPPMPDPDQPTGDPTYIPGDLNVSPPPVIDEEPVTVWEGE